MRDRQFREDENELPYLVNSRRDDYDGRRKSSTLKRDFVNIPFGEFSSRVGWLPLPLIDGANIINSITIMPDNCRFSIHQNGGIIDFEFVVVNEYLVSRFFLQYDSSVSEMDFHSFYHTYDALESMGWFRDEIDRVEKETGLKQEMKDCGYRWQWRDGELTVTDEFGVLVFFSDGGYDSDRHSYKVDFKARKLVKYHVHDWFEFL